MRKAISVVLVRLLPFVAVHSLLAAASASGQVLTLTGGVIQAGSSESDNTARGLVIGGHFSVPVANQFSLRTGATYARRFVNEFAFQSLLGSGGVSVTQVQSWLNYIEIPILLKVSFMANARTSPHLLLGPAVGIKVGCRLRETTTTFDVSGAFLGTDETELSCGGSKAMQIDGRVGLGVDVQVSSGLTAVADVSYSVGLTAISADGPGKSRAVLVRVGVGLPIG